MQSIDSPSEVLLVATVAHQGLGECFEHGDAGGLGAGDPVIDKVFGGGLIGLIPEAAQAFLHIASGGQGEVDHIAN